MLRTMMKKSCDICLLKVVLPIFIIMSIHIKQNLFSFCYLLMFFFVPWLKTHPTKTSNKVGVCWFLVLASTLTCLIVMAQFCFQGVCFFLKCDFSNMSCDSFEQWIQQIGFVDWRTSGTLQILGSVVPDLLLLVTLIEILRRYIRSDSKHVNHYLTGEQYEKLMAAEKLSAALLLAAAAATCRPSAAGALYLVCAQAAGVAWACRWQSRFFAWPPLGALLLVQAAHITALLAAHTPWGRRALPPTLVWCFNLTALTEVNCSSPVEVLYRDVAWEAYVTPVILLTLYAVTGNLMHHTLIKRPKAEHVELAQRLGWHQLAPKLRPRAGSQWYRIVFDAFKTFVYEKYLDEGISILACIVMMVWSSQYMGWTSLLWVVWAAALCLFPNMVTRCLRSSPFIVAYACGLVTAQYLLQLLPVPLLPGRHSAPFYAYGLIDEAFSTLEMCCKGAYTAVFLLLLRQYLEGRVGRALRLGGRLPNYLPATASPFSIAILLLPRLRRVIVLLWIWIVMGTILLFICRREQISLVRIVHLMLLIFFILVFQFSWEGWRNVLSLYWLTLGTIALLALIIEYTLYFPDILVLWKKIGVSEKSLTEMGFCTRETGEIKQICIVDFSCILISVLVQIQLNEDFLDAINIRRIIKYRIQNENQLISTPPIIKHKFGILILRMLIMIIRIVRLVLLYLETHILKFLVISLILLSLLLVNALHFFVYFLALCAILVGHRRRISMMKYCTVVACAHTVQLMIIHFKDMESHALTCVNNITNNFTNYPDPSSFSTTFLEWAGLKAKNPGEVRISVVYHLGFITMSTATVALARYMRFRGLLKGQYRRHTYFLFPKITRAEAELNVKSCFMFLVNFMFYKFGVEICFVAMAVLAGFRWDGYSLFYLSWLVALFAVKRSYLKIMWNALLYTSFASVTIQYIMRLNLPPPFCIGRGWTWRCRWCSPTSSGPPSS